MTVTYTAEVATSRGFGCFWKLLFRWRGSIYKLLWPDLLLYLGFYYFLSFLYRFGLKEDEKRLFEKVSLYCSKYGDLIPVSFVLGFYVSLVVKRWWDSFNCIPWPDSLAFFVSAFIHGQDDRGRLMRRTIMRYVNLALVFTLTCISPCVKKRFPTMDHLVEAGILLPNEKKVIEQMKTSHSTYWMPLVWASSIATRARKEGRIRDDFALKTVIDAIAHYRSLCGGLLNYDWITIPLVYTQVVTLVVYTFFLATLMGRQYLDPAQSYKGNEVDLYIPIFNFLQFFFYMGWLKVAETLVNPFGEDDDDFEMNWVIDRDIQVSYLIVDEMHQEHPELIKDQYWDEVLPDLPYTAASMPFYTEPPQGSAATLIVPPHEAEFVPFETLMENTVEETLEEVKVGEPNKPIPVLASEDRKRLTRNLSESTQSSISGFGRSFHPHSQQQRTVMSLLHRLFSRENTIAGSNISLQSGQSKQIRKAGSKESNICATPSSPPSPTDSRYQSQLHGFPDDIFHLSDLSLAESRATSGMQSPGIFGNFQMLPDFFNRLKVESRAQQPPASSKLHSPSSKLESSDEERCKQNVSQKKHRSHSLKRFFRSNPKLRNSQKSLIDMRRSVHRKQSTSTANTEDSTSMISDTRQMSDVNVSDPTLEPSNAKRYSKSICDLCKRKDSLPLEMPNSQPRASLPYVLNSPPRENVIGMAAKEPSTHTLIASDDEHSSSSSSNDMTERIDLQEDNGVDTRATPPNIRVSHYSPKRKKPTDLRPKRAVSLLIHDKKSYLSNHPKRFSDRKQLSHEVISTPSKSPSTAESNSFKGRLKSKRDILLRKLSKAPPNDLVVTSIDNSNNNAMENANLPLSPSDNEIEPDSDQGPTVV